MSSPKNRIEEHLNGGASFPGAGVDADAESDAEVRTILGAFNVMSDHRCPSGCGLACVVLTIGPMIVVFRKSEGLDSVIAELQDARAKTWGAR